MTEVGKHLEIYTYENILEDLLNRVPEGIDIREGAIIYDALAPSAYQLAEYYMHLKTVAEDAFIETALGRALDLKVSERGLERYRSTRAVRLGLFEDVEGNSIDIPLGTRFSTIEAEGRTFEATERLTTGQYTLIAEEPGSIGNSYYGDILPLENVEGLSKALLDEVVIPGQDEEDDEDLRARYFSSIRQASFGGNWNDYVDTVIGIEGVGAVQVYPIWNGGGTVKVSILDSDYNAPSQSFLNNVKDVLDPVIHSGKGYGLAPIGHQVTVTKPNSRTINVSMHVDVLIGHTKESVMPFIEDAINDYFLSLREAWDDSDELHNYGQTVYRSQIIAAILQVEGIANVANVLLNGSEKDVPLMMTGEVQEAAFLGAVTIT